MLVTVAPSIPPYMRGATPHYDLSPEGIADEVVRACNAGANIVHLHVWDEHGEPTVELNVFQQTIELIRDKCDIIIEGSTGGLNSLSSEQRSATLQTDIEMASLNAGSVNYGEEVYINSPSDILRNAREMHQRNIKPDISIYDVGMIATALQLENMGLACPPLFFTFVLGQEGALPATPKNLFFLSDTVPLGSLWCVSGHCGHDLLMTSLAISLGAHARGGYEDNPIFQNGEVAKSNAQIIERIVRMAHEIGRESASPSEARAMLGLTDIK